MKMNIAASRIQNKYDKFEEEAKMSVDFDVRNEDLINNPTPRVSSGFKCCFCLLFISEHLLDTAGFIRRQ